VLGEPLGDGRGQGAGGVGEPGFGYARELPFAQLPVAVQGAVAQERHRLPGRGSSGGVEDAVAAGALRLHVQFGQQLGDPFVPVGADVAAEVVGAAVGVHALALPAHRFPLLQDGHPVPGPLQFAGDGQAARSGADDGHGPGGCGAG